MGGHIPGAVRFDFSVVANRESKQPIMLPPADQFAQQVGEVRSEKRSSLIGRFCWIFSALLLVLKMLEFRASGHFWL